jgi:menaquinone-dependent protoporphyrinogen oxidase
MKPVLVVYSSRSGHTRRIAEYIATAVRARGQAATVKDAVDRREPFRAREYAGAILASPIYSGRHEGDIIAFASDCRAELDALPAAFVTVSFNAATAEDLARSPEARRRAEAEVRRAVDAFVDRTGWRPSRVVAVGGAILYSQYNVIIRLITKLLVKAHGGPGDTSRDYEYTDWAALDRFAEEFLSELDTRSSAVASERSGGSRGARPEAALRR